MEMGSCITIHFKKSEILAPFRYRQTNANQSLSPQQTAATTPDTVPSMPCLIMKRYTTAQQTF